MKSAGVQIGTKVRLVTQIGIYPAGTVAAVVSKNGYLYEVEFENGRRLIVDGNDVLPVA